MKITKRQLRRIIKEERAKLLREAASEPLAGDDARNPSSPFWAAVRRPEAVEAFKAAGFTSDGKLANRRLGLGVLEMGMYTPRDQNEVEAAIVAALEINRAILEADKMLAAGKYKYSQDAYNDIVSPVQRRHSNTGAADSEGREVVGSWFDRRGWEWD